MPWSFDSGRAHAAWRRWLIALPFAVLLGITLGAVLVRRGLPAGIMLQLALAVPLLTLVAAFLHGLLLQWLKLPPEGLPADGVELVLDVVLGSISGRLLAPVLDVQLAAAIGVGSMILFFQGVIIQKFVVGNLIGDLLGGFLLPPGTPHQPQFSLAASLAARGDYDAARREYEKHTAAAPQDPRPLLHLARMQRQDAHAYADAALTLKRVLALRKLDFATETAVVRELCELYRFRLDDRGSALTALARYVDRNRGRPGVNWARHWIADLKLQS